jgi:hypothetical protein
VRAKSLQEETRVIKMVISDRGMSISSAFSSDLISTTTFRYIHPPEEEEVKEDPEVSRQQKDESEAKQVRAGLVNCV